MARRRAMNGTGRRRIGALLLGLLLPALGHGYESQVHQRLTFYAAKLSTIASRVPRLSR